MFESLEHKRKSLDWLSAKALLISFVISSLIMMVGFGFCENADAFRSPGARIGSALLEISIAGLLLSTVGSIIRLAIDHFRK